MESFPSTNYRSFRLRTVSYTHLDVYKRQEYYCNTMGCCSNITFLALRIILPLRNPSSNHYKRKEIANTVYSRKLNLIKFSPTSCDCTDYYVNLLAYWYFTKNSQSFTKNRVASIDRIKVPFISLWPCLGGQNVNTSRHTQLPEPVRPGTHYV